MITWKSEDQNIEVPLQIRYGCNQPQPHVPSEFQNHKFTYCTQECAVDYSDLITEKKRSQTEDYVTDQDDIILLKDEKKIPIFRLMVLMYWENWVRVWILRKRMK